MVIDMAKYTKQDIIDLVAEEDVEFIRLQFTDIEGNFKNVAITAGQLEKALGNDCMFDCSLVEGMLPTDNASVSGFGYLYDFPMETAAGKGGAFYLRRISCGPYAF